MRPWRKLLWRARSAFVHGGFSTSALVAMPTIVVADYRISAVRAIFTMALAPGTRGCYFCAMSGPLVSGRMRADRLLVERGLFESRAKAQAAIAAGLVTAD